MTPGDTGQFANDSDILLRAGTKVADDCKVAGFFDTIVIDVEAFINAATRYDWSKLDSIATMNASGRGILVDTAACLAAIEGIIWDMSGYTSRIEAEDLINVLRDIALRNISILRDKKTQDFIIGLGTAPP